MATLAHVIGSAEMPAVCSVKSLAQVGQRRRTFVPDFEMLKVGFGLIVTVLLT